jgi:CheY-like chemotaxis protein
VEIGKNVRVLALLSSDIQNDIRRQLSSLDMSITCITSAEELGNVVRHGEIYQVALLPASLLDMDWWTVWGEIALLEHRPAILVYAHSATFQLWSGVLEAGGYDVIVEPFSSEKFTEAIVRAASSFEQNRNLPDSLDDESEA